MAKVIQAARGPWSPTAGRMLLPAWASTSTPFANGKTSVRAAYGIFWDQARLIAWNRYSTAQPFDENLQINGQAPGQYLPSLTGTSVFDHSGGVVNPFPFVIPRTPEERQAFSPQYGGFWPTAAEGTVLPPNFNEGYSGQWNLTIEQEVARNWVLSASYIGNHGTHLFMSIDYNYAPLSSYDHSATLQDNLNNIPNRRRFAFVGNCGINPNTASTIHVWTNPDGSQSGLV